MPTPESPVSNPASYCTGAEMIQWVDVRWIGDRLQDLGARVTAASVPTDTNLAAILQGASGRLEAALFRAGRYGPEDLITLTGNSQKYLKRMVAYLAACDLFNRRPQPVAMPAQWQQAEADLEQLASGGWVFGQGAQIQAGYAIPVLTFTGPARFMPYKLTRQAHRLLPSNPYSGPFNGRGGSW